MISLWRTKSRTAQADGPADAPVVREAPAAITPAEAPRQNFALPGGPAFARQAPTAEIDDGQARPAERRSPFTPTQPVQSADALIGRRELIERAIAAIELERAHVAIFGERGHGKTSLANIVAGLADEAGFGVIRQACSAGASFSELIGEVLDKIPARYLSRAEDEPHAPFVAGGPGQGWTVATATAALKRIRFGHVLIFIDEFDRLAAQNARRDMAELLKNCSDMALRASFVLIGVAESLGELLSLHQSIHRNLVALPMPLLTDADLSILLTQGCERLGLVLEWEAEKLLLQLAHQSPYTAQKLGLLATVHTQRRGDRVVTKADAAAAARQLMEESRPVFAPLLDPLPLDRKSPDGVIWADLLHEAARAPCDGFGWFIAKDVNVPHCEDDLATLTRPDAGPLLRARRLSGRVEFTFTRANLRSYMLLRGAERTGVI
jgi:hypothetical protein